MGDCSFLSLVREPTGAIVPKNIVPRDRSRGGRKSDLNLFISKFSSLTDCTLIHWPSQLKSTGSDWWLCIDTQNHPFMGLRTKGGPCVTSSLNLVVFGLLYIRDNSINLLLLSLPRTHGLQDFIFSTVSTVSPATLLLTEIWQSFQDLMSDVWSLKFILILILLLLIGVTAVHFYSIRQKTCSWVTVLSSHWSGNRQAPSYPKTLYHATDHVVDERAISIYLSLNLVA